METAKRVVIRGGIGLEPKDGTGRGAYAEFEMPIEVLTMSLDDVAERYLKPAFLAARQRVTEQQA